MPPRHTQGPVIAPAYTGRMSMAAIPALRMPDESMNPDAAYRFIHDELMLDGSSRLNLATFVTTWMDPQAEKLMADNGYKIDWKDYFSGISSYFATSKGEMYSFPFNSSTALLYWNKDAYAKIGKDHGPATSMCVTTTAVMIQPRSRSRRMSRGFCSFG